MASTSKSTKPGQTESGSLNGVTFEEVKLQRARPVGLDEMLSQIDTLMHSDDYDDDFQAPTPNAAARTRAFLEGAGRSLVTAFPSGTICADGVGAFASSGYGLTANYAWLFPDPHRGGAIFTMSRGRTMRRTTRRTLLN